MGAHGAARTRVAPSEEVSVVQAYILIQTEVGKAAQVAKQVRDIPGVTEAELNRAKSNYIAEYVYDSDSQSSLARRYGFEP